MEPQPAEGVPTFEVKLKQHKEKNIDNSQSATGRQECARVFAQTGQQ